MEKSDLLAHALTCEAKAKETKNDETRVRWLLHQARNFRRMAAEVDEPKVDSHHTQFYWKENEKV